MFVVEKKKFRLRHELTQQEVDEIVALADKLFNPPRFVTRARAN